MFHDDGEEQAVAEPWCPEHCLMALKKNGEYIAGGHVLWLSLARHSRDNLIQDDIAYRDVEDLAQMMQLQLSGNFQRHSHACACYPGHPRSNKHSFPVTVEAYTWEVPAGYPEVLHFLSDMKPVAVWWVPRASVSS